MNETNSCRIQPGSAILLGGRQPQDPQAFIAEFPKQVDIKSFGLVVF